MLGENLLVLCVADRFLMITSYCMLGLLSYERQHKVWYPFIRIEDNMSRVKKLLILSFVIGAVSGLLAFFDSGLTEYHVITFQETRNATICFCENYMLKNGLFELTRCVELTFLSSVLIFIVWTNLRICHIMRLCDYVNLPSGELVQSIQRLEENKGAEEQSVPLLFPFERYYGVPLSSTNDISVYDEHFIIRHRLQRHPPSHRLVGSRGPAQNPVAPSFGGTENRNTSVTSGVRGLIIGSQRCGPNVGSHRKRPSVSSDCQRIGVGSDRWPSFTGWPSSFVSSPAVTSKLSVYSSAFFTFSSSQKTSTSMEFEKNTLGSLYPNFSSLSNTEEVSTPTHALSRTSLNRHVSSKSEFSTGHDTVACWKRVQEPPSSSEIQTVDSSGNVYSSPAADHQRPPPDVIRVKPAQGDCDNNAAVGERNSTDAGQELARAPDHCSVNMNLRGDIRQSKSIPEGANSEQSSSQKRGKISSYQVDKFLHIKQPLDPTQSSPATEKKDNLQNGKEKSPRNTDRGSSDIDTGWLDRKDQTAVQNILQNAKQKTGSGKEQEKDMYEEECRKQQEMEQRQKARTGTPEAHYATRSAITCCLCPVQFCVRRTHISRRTSPERTLGSDELGNAGRPEQGPCRHTLRHCRPHTSLVSHKHQGSPDLHPKVEDTKVDATRSFYGNSSVRKVSTKHEQNRDETRAKVDTGDEIKTRDETNNSRDEGRELAGNETKERDFETPQPRDDAHTGGEVSISDGVRMRYQQTGDVIKAGNETTNVRDEADIENKMNKTDEADTEDKVKKSCAAGTKDRMISKVQIKTITQEEIKEWRRRHPKDISMPEHHGSPKCSCTGPHFSSLFHQSKRQRLVTPLEPFPLLGSYDLRRSYGSDLDSRSYMNTRLRYPDLESVSWAYFVCHCSRPCNGEDSDGVERQSWRQKDTNANQGDFTVTSTQLVSQDDTESKEHPDEEDFIDREADGQRLQDVSHGDPSHDCNANNFEPASNSNKERQEEEPQDGQPVARTRFVRTPDSEKQGKEVQVGRPTPRDTHVSSTQLGVDVEPDGLEQRQIRRVTLQSDQLLRPRQRGEEGQRSYSSSLKSLRKAPGILNLGKPCCPGCCRKSQEQFDREHITGKR